MNNLDSNLYSKIELKFNADGKFKILMMSDIQETLDYDKRTLEGINKIIEYTKTNLVVLGGDNCDGTVIKTEKELKDYLDIFSEPMEKRKIPWMHVFGNHDYDVTMDDIYMAKIYESYNFWVSKHTEDIYDITNYVLTIKYSKKDEIEFNIWALDTFSTILQRKDIKCIGCGHSHNDCFEGEFVGIKMCLDACAEYSPYGTDDLRGGRVFEINENNTSYINTYMVHYKDIWEFIAKVKGSFK